MKNVRLVVGVLLACALVVGLATYYYVDYRPQRIDAANAIAAQRDADFNQLAAQLNDLEERTKSFSEERQRILKQCQLGEIAYNALTTSQKSTNPNLKVAPVCK